MTPSLPSPASHDPITHKCPGLPSVVLPVLKCPPCPMHPGMSQGSFSPADIPGPSGPMCPWMSWDVLGCPKAPSAQQTSQAQVVPCVPGCPGMSQVVPCIPGCPGMSQGSFSPADIPGPMTHHSPPLPPMTPSLTSPASPPHHSQFSHLLACLLPLALPPDSLNRCECGLGTRLACF